jgi:post-segregation antitoxin (ccd killing protein)
VGDLNVQNREIRLRVSGELFADVVSAARARGIPVSNVVRLALSDYLRKSKPAPVVELPAAWLDDDAEPLNVGS